MKRILLLMILLFQITFVFGQTNWSQWGSLPCFKGFQFAVVNNGLVQSINQYSWQAKIKSTYTQKVTFNMTWIVGGEEVSIGQVTLQPGKEYLHTSRYFNSNADILYVKVSEVNFSDKLNCYAECDNGSPNQPNCSNSNSANSSPDTSATQQNDLTDYNNSKADLERELAEHNAGIQKQNEENQRQQFNKLYNEGVSLKSEGNFGAAKNRFNDALKFATNENEKRQAKQALNQNEADGKVYVVGAITKTTTDLITYFANRKNALRNSLSQEDGKALLEIVNTENPTDYVQNIIAIFSDLGYTHKETEKESSMTTITMNNDINNINDLLHIFIRPAGNSNFNSISFIYHRKKKLLEQLAVLLDDLEGFSSPELKGVPPSRQKKVADAEKGKKELDQKKLEFEKSSAPIKSISIIESNITVQSIIDKHINAIGDLTKLKAVKNITYIENDEEGFVSKKIWAYNKSVSFRMKEGEKPQHRFVANNGKGYVEMDGVRNILDKDAIPLFFGKNIQPFSILKLKQSQDLKLGEMVILNGKECYTIIENVSFKAYKITSYKTFKYYFDSVSGLWIGTEESDGTNKSYTYYDDYREVEGILFPFTETFNNLGGTNTMGYSSIKINEPLTDKDFE